MFSIKEWIDGRKAVEMPSDFFQGACDVHAHLIPGVDDGLQTPEDTAAALQWYKDAGFKAVTATPHFMTDTANSEDEIRAAFSRIVPPEGLKFALAGEYMIDDDFAGHLSDGPLTFADRHLLIETSYVYRHPNFYDIMFDISLAGYHPVVAHPERYAYVTEKTYDHLADIGCPLQLNLLSLSGAYGGTARAKALQLLKDQRYTFIGTDLHSLEAFRSRAALIRLNVSQWDSLRLLFENNECLFG